MFTKLKNYIIESRQEFRRVNWPSREETIRLTLIVIGMSVAFAIFLGASDALFQFALQFLVLD